MINSQSSSMTRQQLSTKIAFIFIGGSSWAHLIHICACSNIIWIQTLFQSLMETTSFLKLIMINIIQWFHNPWMMMIIIVSMISFKASTLLDKSIGSQKRTNSLSFNLTWLQNQVNHTRCPILMDLIIKWFILAIFNQVLKKF